MRYIEKQHFLISSYFTELFFCRSAILKQNTYGFRMNESDIHSASTATSTTTEATSEAAASTSGSKTDVAFVTDVGNIDDQSFNQYTWQGVQDFCSANSLNANYYRPTEDSDAARLEQMDNAVNDGAKSIVVAGYLFGNAIAEAQEKYPDVQFLALDVSASDLGDKAPTANTALITYKEEQAGYLAGYAAVYDGYKELGFLGGMAVPAVIRYGYGFVQGADAAAAELGQNIEINYFYGGQFYGDANITSRMEGWYSNGTQVVFACGGGIYTSAVEAALKNNGYVIGVDVDQNYIGANGVADGTYAYNPFITSAMKGLSEAVNTALADIDAGSWDDIAGSNGNFGLEDGDYIGLPTDADSWNFESFTTDEYEEVKGKIKSGEITVDNSSDDATKPTVSEFTTVNYIQ